MMFGVLFLALGIGVLIQSLIEGKWIDVLGMSLIIAFIVGCVMKPIIIVGAIGLGVVFSAVGFLIGAIKHDCDRF